MRIRIAVPDAHVTPAVLNAALEATTAANEAMISAGEVPLVSELIKRGRVKWKPEPFKDGEHFDLISQFKDRGWADCDDLGPALAAELRATGRDAGARSVVMRSGPKTWHAVTELSDGRILDPSRAAGMGHKIKGLNGSNVMASLGGAVIGLRPARGQWAARCDLPIDGTPSALCGVSYGRTAFDAITRAVDGATLVGEASELADPQDIARALAIQAACSGADYRDALEALSGHLDAEEVGSIFSSLKSLAPLASLIPIPGAGLAAQALTSLIPDEKGGAAPAPAGAQPGAPGAPGAPTGAGPEPWGLKVRKGASVSRAPNGAWMIRF